MREVWPKAFVRELRCFRSNESRRHFREKGANEKGAKGENGARVISHCGKPLAYGICFSAYVACRLARNPIE